jgi:hypothetical protein
MKNMRLFFFITMVSLLVVVTAVAQQPTPHTFPKTPQTPFSSPQTVDTPADARNTNALPSLKAVLLVGPIDGDTGSWTLGEIESMELAANELEKYGVTVHKFYTPNNDWEQIKAAADGAHFLFYRGHGVYWSAMPSPTVGGFALKDKFASSDDIRNDLNLAPNAIIMLYGCFTAGSSSNDTISISSAEAQRRVAQYADPFFDIGAAGYYANWFGSAFQMFVRYLFQGSTLGQAYEAYFDFNSSTVERYVHPDHPSMAMWLDKDYWYDPLPQYNHAFVGSSNATLTDLFQPTTMVLSPTTITYLAEPSYPAQTVPIQVDSNDETAFTWTASLTAVNTTWIEVTPLTGASGGTVDVLMKPSVGLGTYQAVVDIVSSDTAIEDYAQSVSVELRVIEQVYATYLPIVLTP